MDILFLTQVLPYPIDAGPKVRGYYNLRYLAEKHRVTLLSFVRSTDTQEALSHLESLCTHIETVPMIRSNLRDGLALLKSFFSGKPFFITRDEVREMDSTIQKLVKQNRFDAVHADQLWMAPYALKAKKEAIKNGYHPQIFLDQHNAVYLVPKRMADATSNRVKKTWLYHEARLMAKFETETCRQFDHVVWVTHEDLRAINSLENVIDHRKPASTGLMAQYESNIVIPICVDALDIKPVECVSKSKNILFVGGMHWPPNADGVTWFVNEVFPLISSRNPLPRFIVVGRQPPQALQDMERVLSTGYVENPDSFWSNARVFVVPVRAGGGMRVKILDAWARGIPIVSTTIGAEGIIYQPGKDIWIADTALDFANAVQNILTEDSLAQSLSFKGRQTLENYYDWRKIYPAWDTIYK
jgi:glycosyltransferase involved in cell wall biosynthesis